MRLIRVFLGVALLGMAAASVAEPTHYVVFEIGKDGAAEPVYYTRVDLPSPAIAVKVREDGVAGSEHERVDYRLFRGGVDVGEESVEVPTVIRGEFAPSSSPDDAIEGVRIVPERRSFVVRVPVARADALEFSSLAKRSQRFDLDALAARAANLVLGGLAPLRHDSATVAAAAGNPANRVDLLVLGDGYTSAQQARFAADAASLRTAMFAVTPYKEYASFVNWTAGFVASSQSGADHPPYAAGCTTTSCCADAAARQDPSAGRFVSTAFDGRFCTSQIHRLLTVNASKLYAAAASWPNWDKIVVVVNDTVYGGSGGSTPVTSMSPEAAQVVMHEYGHSFTLLADEYTTPYPGFPYCSDYYAGYPRCEANVTDRTTQVKWASWYTAGNPIPTPPGRSGVGLFQGARYLTSGMYRPVDQCLMRTRGRPFCPVCRQEYVRKLYAGGFGVPAAGIDTIEPGTEFPATTSPVDYTVNTQKVFGATLLAPTPNTLTAQWYLDGNPIAGANGASYTFRQTAASPATRTLQLRVTDQSPYVASTMAGNLMVSTRTWTVRVVP
jgi:hypothetical protein